MIIFQPPVTVAGNIDKGHSMNRHGYIGRKVRQPRIQKQPALVIVTFGSTNRGAAALESFRQAITETYPEHRIFWAYTSAVIRKKTGNPSLHEALAQAEAENFRKVVVQPLYVFPGTEYQQIEETCEFFPGLRIFLGETLMHRWQFIEETIGILEKEFLSNREGLNLLVLHGTPLAADPVNIVYLGLDRFLRDRYDNVRAATVEGVPDFEGVKQVLIRTKAPERWPRIQMIPLLFLAGIHAEDDLMGEDESWKTELEAAGFQDVSCLTTVQNGEEYFKGLGYYPEVVKCYLKRLKRVISLSEVY